MISMSCVRRGRGLRPHIPLGSHTVQHYSFPGPHIIYEGFHRWKIATCTLLAACANDILIFIAGIAVSGGLLHPERAMA
jgi:hypothetical protein